MSETSQMPPDEIVRREKIDGLAMPDPEATYTALVALRHAAAPILVWWAMVEAQETLSEGYSAISMPDERTILHFLGSGASTTVSAGQLRDFFEVASKAALLLMTPEQRAECEQMLEPRSGGENA